MNELGREARFRSFLEPICEKIGIYSCACIKRSLRHNWLSLGNLCEGLGVIEILTFPSFFKYPLVLSEYFFLL